MNRDAQRQYDNMAEDDDEIREAARSRRRGCPVPREDLEPDDSWMDYEYDPLSRGGFE